MAQDNKPNDGPFPAGDSRNVTLTQGGNPIEPARTGPQEHDHRGDTAHEAGEEKSLLDTVKEAPGELIASLTPQTGSDGLIGGLVDKVRDAFDDDSDGESGAQSAASTSEHVTTRVDEGQDDIGTPAEPYSLQQEPEPGAADNAFGVKGGGLTEPVLQKDWNPAERNSDDLSR